MTNASTCVLSAVTFSQLMERSHASAGFFISSLFTAFKLYNIFQLQPGTGSDLTGIKEHNCRVHNIKVEQKESIVYRLRKWFTDKNHTVRDSPGISRHATYLHNYTICIETQRYLDIKQTGSWCPRSYQNSKCQGQSSGEVLLNN